MQHAHQQVASGARSPSQRDGASSQAQGQDQIVWQDLGGIPVQCNAKFRTLIIDGCWIHFTPLEFDIIAVLLNHFGRGVLPQDIYRAAFGGVYTDTRLERLLIHRHIKNARPKLQAHGLTINALHRKRGYALIRLPDESGIQEGHAPREP